MNIYYLRKTTICIAAPCPVIDLLRMFVGLSNLVEEYIVIIENKYFPNHSFHPTIVHIQVFIIRIFCCHFTDSSIMAFIDSETFTLNHMFVLKSRLASISFYLKVQHMQFKHIFNKGWSRLIDCN